MKAIRKEHADRIVSSLLKLTAENMSTTDIRTLVFMVRDIPVYEDIQERRRKNDQEFKRVADKIICELEARQEVKE